MEAPLNLQTSQDFVSYVRPEIRAYALAMEQEMRLHAVKEKTCHWRQLAPAFIVSRLMAHLATATGIGLGFCLSDDDDDMAGASAMAHIGNYAMMLWSREGFRHDQAH